MEKAVQFLDDVAFAWTEDRGCFSCHTNYAYLIARPMTDPNALMLRDVRASAEKMVAGWEKTPPKRYYEVPGHAAYLAINDALTGNVLSPSARAALDRMWTLQKDDGSFRFPDCKWPPMESDQHFGNTMVALAIGMAPEHYATRPEIQAGLGKLRAFLAANPPRNIHQRAMIAWASLHLTGLADEALRSGVAKDLRAIQNEDGGWSLSRFGDYARGDGKQQTTDSDGYGTGFSIFLLRQLGVPATDPQIQRGVTWLKSHQRQSGRWFTRSVFKDSRHYISHAGTAFAVMALASCGETSRAGE
jgi:squalene-hopene/tetraprenyl-beta-curcumene cyclase